MKKLLATTAMTMLLAVPAFAQAAPATTSRTDLNIARGDAEVKQDYDWQKVVAQANANREQQEANSATYAATRAATTQSN